MKKNILIIFIFLIAVAFSSSALAAQVDQNGVNMLIGAKNAVQLYKEYGDVSGLNQAISQMQLFLSEYTEPSGYIGQAYEILGDAYYLLKNYSQSSNAYKMAMEYLPQNTKDYEYSVYSLGYSYMKMGNYPDAIKYLSMLYTSQTYGDQAKALVGGMYVTLGQYSQATSVLDTIQSNEWKAWAYYYRGRIYFDMGDYSDALSILQKVSTYSNDPEVVEPSIYYTAYSLINTGKIQEAIDTASNAIKSYPPTEWTFDLYVILGQSYYDNGQYKLASDTFSTAIQIAPQGTNKIYEALSAKAWAEYKLGNYDSAISNWENVLSNSTNVDLAFSAGINVGSTLREDKHFNEAITLYKKMETQFPSQINQIRLEEGKAYLESGDYADATTIFTALSKLSEPLKDLSIYWLAYTYNLENNYQSAISTLSSLIQTTQSSDTKAQAYALEGEIYSKASQYSNAIIAYKNAISFGNAISKLDAQYTLGQIYYNNSDYKDAIVQFSIVVNNRIIDPNLALNAAYYLSQCYVGLKDYTSAIATYDWIAKYDFADLYRSSIYVLKVIAMEKLGLYAQVPSYIDGVLNAYPNLTTKYDLMYYKADAYLNVGNVSQAYSIVNSISNQNMSNDAKGGVLYIEAKYYQSTNDLQKAEQYYKQVYMYYPSSSEAPNAAYDLGKLYYTLKDYSNAKDAFFAFVSLFSSDPRVPEAFYDIGLSYENLGQSANAIQVYNSLISKFPTSSYSIQAKSRITALEKR
jgi:tetratricopeptide (TPR) repeat protein